MSLWRNPVVLIFTLVGVGFGLGGGFLGYSQWQVHSWPRVPARVLEARVETLREGQYTPLVRVSYQAAGQAHEKVLSQGVTTSKLTLAQEFLADYPVGELHPLPLNPADPQDLRLLPGMADFILVGALIGGGALFILIPIGVLALSERSDAIRLGGYTMAGVGGLFVLVGLGMAWSCYQVLNGWPTVEASVSAASVEKFGRRYGLALQFDYELQGKAYHINTGSSWTSSSASLVERQLVNWAPGSRHTLRYCPNSPEVVSFEAAWSATYFAPSLLFLGLGAVTAGLGLAIARFLGK